MKKLLVLLFLAGAALGQEPAKTARLEELNRDVWRPFIEGVNADKPELYVGIRTADFRWVAPGSNGRVMDLREYDDDSRAVMRQRKEEGTRSELDVRFLERNVHGDFAAEKCIQKFTLQRRGQAPETFYGAAHYFSRKENGKWRVFLQYGSTEKVSAESFAAAARLDDTARFLPAPKNANARHLIYLHGRIVQEQQSARPRHAEHGYYELEAIADAFRQRGFNVTAEIRPKEISVSDAADAVVARVRKLRESGVPADRITVVGASMGASIALRVAARLREPEVRFALLSPCLSSNMPAVYAEEKAYPAGRLLVIREETDVPSSGCPAWSGDVPGLQVREAVIETGLRHGFLYRPLPEWLGPVVEWASR